MCNACSCRIHTRVYIIMCYDLYYGILTRYKRRASTCASHVHCSEPVKSVIIFFFFFNAHVSYPYRTRRLLRVLIIMYCVLDFGRSSSSLSSFFFSPLLSVFFFEPRPRAASLPESERDNDRFAFVGLITYRWKRVCQPRTADGGGGGGPDERGSEREREREIESERRREKIPKHVFIIIITYYGVLMIFNYYCREPYGLINRDQSNYILLCTRVRALPLPIFSTDTEHSSRVFVCNTVFETATIHLPYKRYNNNSNNNRERINNIIIFDSVHAIPEHCSSSRPRRRVLL